MCCFSLKGIGGGMMNNIKFDASYKEWIQDISKRFKQSQLKAAVKVNDEMLRFYWVLGKEMEANKVQYAWGSRFYDQISRDLKKVLPDVKSFSVRNLQYMHQFYRTFPKAGITPRAGAQIDTKEITPQPDAQIFDEKVFYIPWGHLKAIMDKCRDDRGRALFLTLGLQAT